ncbi:hypothetical protein ABK040_001065 [Willaertia magna]
MSNFFLYGYAFPPQEFNLKGLKNNFATEFIPLQCVNFKYTKIYTCSSNYVVFKSQRNEIYNLNSFIVQAIINFCKEEYKKITNLENLENLNLETKNLLFKNLKTNEIYTLENCTCLNLEKTFIKIGWLTNHCNVDIYFDTNKILLLDLNNKLNIIQINNRTGEIKKINFNEKIKFILTGPLGNDCCIVLENNKVIISDNLESEELTFYNLQNNLENNLQKELKYEMICGSRGGSGFCLVVKENHVINNDHVNNNIGDKTTTINTIYGRGVDTLGGYGANFTSHNQSFIKINSPLIQKEQSPIISVKAGYWHHLFLLENGKVIGVGYNVLNQTNGEIFGTQNICDFTYCMLDQFIPNLGKIKKIGCSSRGTYFWNEKDEIYFIGEVVEKFGESLRMKINGNVSNVYKMELKSLREQYGSVVAFAGGSAGSVGGYGKKEDYFPNEVVCGGWHYFIAYDKDVDDDGKGSKDLKYFFMKLKEMSGKVGSSANDDDGDGLNNLLCDISFN